MKLTKFIVIACGAVGIAAFFMPLVHIQALDTEVKPSAWDIVKGIKQTEKAVDAVKDVADSAADQAGDTATKAKLSGAKAEFDDAAKKLTYIVLGAFSPAVLFLLLGGIGAMGRFGRGLGAMTFIFGLIGIFIWMVIKAMGDESGASEAFGPAYSMLAVSYFGGALGGLVALIKPEAKIAA